MQTNTNGRNLLKKTRMMHHIMLDVKDQTLLCLLEQLPFESDSIDLTICQHIIEKNEANLGLLNELFRITIPEGRVVIFSFNPFSFAGLRNLTFFDGKFPWNSKFISMGDTQKKLKECGFSIEQGKLIDYQLLFSDAYNYSKHLDDVGARWLPLLGNIYFIVAKKEVPGITPIRPKWNKMKAVKAVTNK